MADQVLESVKGTTQDRQTVWSKSLAAGFAAVIVTGLLINQMVTQTTPESSLEIMLASSDRVYRGVEAKKGDFMQVTAHPQKLEYLQIRVYRDGRLYEFCGVEPPCQFKDDAAIHRVELKSLGEYHTVMIESDKQISFTANRLDKDVLMAHDLAAQVTEGESINVR